MLVVLLLLLNDGFKLNNLGLKLMNVIFLVDGLWDFDFIMLWWSWEEFVVLYDFGGEFGFEMLLGLFEGGDLLVEVGDLLFWEGELFESFFVVNFVLIDFLEFEEVLGLLFCQLDIFLMQEMVIVLKLKS